MNTYRDTSLGRWWMTCHISWVNPNLYPGWDLTAQPQLNHCLICEKMKKSIENRKGKKNFLFATNRSSLLLKQINKSLWALLCSFLSFFTIKLLQLNNMSEESLTSVAQERVVQWSKGWRFKSQSVIVSFGKTLNPHCLGQIWVNVGWWSEGPFGFELLQWHFVKMVCSIILFYFHFWGVFHPFWRVIVFISIQLCGILLLYIWTNLNRHFVPNLKKDKAAALSLVWRFLY